MLFTTFDELMMNRCIELAKNGLGTTYPNPLVGSVITHNRKIIGEGWHQKAGMPHAEINAIASVKNKDLLKESTLYVNLEPCSHFGKTPPCADAIIENNIPKVIIGIIDHSSKVNGKGIERLKNRGIEVGFNCLEKKNYDLNKRFFTFHQKKRPYLILKWAESADGFIGVESEPIKISNVFTQQLSHQWRTQEQAILVGKNTARIDNPQLTARLYKGNDPVRIVIDKNIDLPPTNHVFDNNTKTIVFNQWVSKVEMNIKFIQLDCNASDFLENALHELYKIDVQSVIIEGGSYTLQQFIDKSLWDEARVFRNPNRIIAEGIKAPHLTFHRLARNEKVAGNIFSLYLNEKFIPKLIIQ